LTVLLIIRALRVRESGLRLLSMLALFRRERGQLLLVCKQNLRSGIRIILFNKPHELEHMIELFLTVQYLFIEVLYL